MSAPRRPRGEKPAVTIRYLRRQMATMEHTLRALRMACDDKDKVIAGFDVQMSEQEDQINILQRRNEAQSAAVASAKQEIRSTIGRLAYLEGYFYAKEKETPINQTFPPVRAAGPYISRNTAEAIARSGSRDPEGVQIRRQTAESAGSAQSTERHGATHGDKVRSFGRSHREDPEGSTVEYVEITEQGTDQEYGAQYWMKA